MTQVRLAAKWTGNDLLILSNDATFCLGVIGTMTHVYRDVTHRSCRPCYIAGLADSVFRKFTKPGTDHPSAWFTVETSIIALAHSATFNCQFVVRLKSVKRHNKIDHLEMRKKPNCLESVMLLFSRLSHLVYSLSVGTRDNKTNDNCIKLIAISTGWARKLRIKLMAMMQQ